MIHIKRIDETMNTKTYGKRTEYVITNCGVTVAEDNYKEGESDYYYSSYDVDIKAETLDGLMRDFVERECYGHKFNIDDWVYDTEKPNRLELSVMGKLLKNGNIYFEEPTQDDWRKFKQNKMNLTSFVFNINVEKRIVDDNLVSEFRRIGVPEM